MDENRTCFCMIFRLEGALTSMRFPSQLTYAPIGMTFRKSCPILKAILKRAGRSLNPNDSAEPKLLDGLSQHLRCSGRGLIHENNHTAVEALPSRSRHWRRQ